MPTYEYKCSGCEQVVEIFQSITARPVKKCPLCGKLKLKRLLGTGAGLIFKGSGFYATDYRSEGYKKAAQGERPAAPADKKETKTETKSETKTESTSPARDKKTA
ncbi:MAG: zinc ribbon domain-containing protein [Planctomycetaceae bacterium]|nr:zinc ribbon domain-containing protein [Planctomycetaceae bacterium]